MITFFKKYNYDIFKVQMNQFCVALIAAVMTFFSMGNDPLYLVTNLGCAILYIYIMYTMFYELGKNDKPAIDAGRAEFRFSKGVGISLLGNTICIVCAIMVAVFSFFAVYQKPVTVLDADGNEIKVYVSKRVDEKISADDETSEIKAITKLTEVPLFSNEGGEIRTVSFDRARECQTAQSSQLYDEHGNALRFYADTKMTLSTTQELSTDHWASSFYSLPRAIVIFLQIMFVGFKDIVSDTLHISPDFYYIITVMIPVLFSMLAYRNGAKGKRILFFLPERKQKPKY